LAWSTRIVPLVVLLVCACLAAPAGATHVQCGDTITQDTTLDSDLACDEGLAIGADSVTLDLGGHAIAGPDGQGTGVRCREQSGVVIRDGTIRGFEEGVQAEECADTTVSHVHLDANTVGIDVYFGKAPNRITDSRITGGRVGMRIQGGFQVARNEIGDNSFAGMLLDFTSGTIEDNTIRGNGRGIDLEEAQAVITGNRILDNEGPGIRYDYWQEGEVLDNRIERNGTGILDEGASTITIRGNVVRANRGDGAHVKALAPISENRFNWNGASGLRLGDMGYGFGPAGCVVSRNLAYRNQRNGIVLEGGDTGCGSIRVAGNHVHHNGSDGLLVTGSRGEMHLRANRAEHNGDDGIDVDSREFSMGDGAWSPDGSLIAGTVTLYDEPPSSINLFAADGSGARALVEGVRASWSPTGTQLAYQADDGVHVVNADGSGDRFVAAGGAPQWSPAGTTIMLQNGSGIYAIEAGGGAPTLLGSGSDPEWSPTGDRVVFQRSNEVLIVNADGTGATSLIEGGNPTWSPDGERIAVTDGLDLVTVRTDGSDPQHLTMDEPADYSPDWSPDGSRIAFLRAEPGRIATYVVSATGGPIDLVAAGDTPPLWSPGSDRLLLGRTVVRPDGTLAAELGLSFNPFVTLRSNVGDSNSDLGIEAVEQVTDAGDNRAAGNGDARQCVGVACG